MIYIVTDRNNKDREDFIVDVFESRPAAESFVEERKADPTSPETYQIEEWESEEDARGITHYDILLQCAREVIKTGGTIDSVEDFIADNNFITDKEMAKRAIKQAEKEWAEENEQD